MDFLSIGTSIILPLITLAGGSIIRNLLNRLDIVEQKVKDTMSETEIRQLLADKLDPVKEQSDEIKEATKKIFELMWAQKLNPNKSNNEDDK